MSTRIEPIGGNHSRTAFARLLETVSESTDPYMAAKWRYAFLRIKTFFYIFFNSRYRDSILFADNLTTDEAQFLGNLHNADAELQRKATFMDKLSLARKSWFDEGTDNVQQRWLRREKRVVVIRQFYKNGRRLFLRSWVRAQRKVI
jgi:hypothetical protein